MTPCRLMVDPPWEGAWNMAVDEALLDDASGGAASLRFYQWREPTLSLGYFQPYAQREQHAASRRATTVRRLSGGGALLHDRELTYSLCLPASHPLGRRPAGLYGLVHRALVETLAALGVVATLHGDDQLAAAIDPGDADEPFLCFARRTAMDVVAAGGQRGPAAKIAGSAQRRRRGAVMQHGSVLLAASPLAPELPGLAELAGVALAPAALIAPWSERLAQRLELDLPPQSETAANRNAASQLRSARYACPSWTERI